VVPTPGMSWHSGIDWVPDVGADARRLLLERTLANLLTPPTPTTAVATVRSTYRRCPKRGRRLPIRAWAIYMLWSIGTRSDAVAPPFATELQDEIEISRQSTRIWSNNPSNQFVFVLIMTNGLSIWDFPLIAILSPPKKT
jgi:hypothetical protein